MVMAGTMVLAEEPRLKPGDKGIVEGKQGLRW